MVKAVSTTIDDELWRKAQVANIPWTKALKMGINILLGSDSNLVALREELVTVEAKRKYLNETIAKYEKLQVEKSSSDAEVLKYLPLLKECSERIFKNIDFLKGGTKSWFRQTGQLLAPEEFFQLCKRLKDGEFGDGK